VITTILRAKDNIKRRNNLKYSWFGPIHGARYQDLLEYSSIEMSKLDFGVFAIGGLVKAFLNYRFDLTIKILLTVKQNIRPNKPIHMFGLGLPQFFSLAIACGCDLMDSAAYILYANQNRYFTLSTGTERLEDLNEFPCHCPICCEYNPKEVLKFDRNLRIELLARHNLYISFSELRTIRQAIREGNLWELVDQRIRAHPALVKAARVVKEHVAYFEKHEKVYKDKGRLYSSSRGKYRPLVIRYDNKMVKNFRLPPRVKFLVIFPELGTRPKNSPSIMYWSKYIENMQKFKLESTQVSYFSLFYGIVPIELLDTYPLSQYESISYQEKNDILYTSSIQKSLNFLNKNAQFFKKIAFFIPEKYENQFGEINDFPIDDPINELHSIFKSKNNNIKISKFNKIEDIEHFLK